MKIEKAIEILKERVEVDRRIRGYENPKNDYELFCERQNIAIETLIKEVEGEN